jgi:hypothetical protein
VKKRQAQTIEFDANVAMNSVKEGASFRRISHLFAENIARIVGASAGGRTG